MIRRPPRSTLFPYTRSSDLSSSPNVALLWDAHHTSVSGKEQPEDTVRQLGRYIRHTHLKDSVAAGNDRRYVLTGTGDVRRSLPAATVATSSPAPATCP